MHCRKLIEKQSKRYIFNYYFLQYLVLLWELLFRYFGKAHLLHLCRNFLLNFLQSYARIFCQISCRAEFTSEKFPGNQFPGSSIFCSYIRDIARGWEGRLFEEKASSLAKGRSLEAHLCGPGSLLTRNLTRSLARRLEAHLCGQTDLTATGEKFLELLSVPTTARHKNRSEATFRLRGERFAGVFSVSFS